MSSDSISVRTPLTGETWYGVIAFGVSGANTASPFDPNPLLPKAQANINCPGFSAPCNTGVSTSNANDFVFQFGGDTGYITQTAGAGMTLIQYEVFLDRIAYAQYQIAANPLSTATLSFGAAQGFDFGVIVDTIQPSSSSTTSSTTTSTTTISGSPPSLDGSAKNGCGYVSSCSVTLSTVNPSDVIVVGCNYYDHRRVLLRDRHGRVDVPAEDRSDSHWWGSVHTDVVCEIASSPLSSATSSPSRRL